ncbi:MAG: TRAM domain-containing protein [Armatimonadetes bacterium]|nr:TRAM domain-containing protein [Armatimonadota bacterium]
MVTSIFVDTCALADKGLSLSCRLGLLDGQHLVVLKSVVRESLRLRTAPAPDKQEVGQQAVLTLAELHSLPCVTVVLDRKEPTAKHPDDDLLNRARAVQGRILTADTLLQERARTSGIGVVAMQELNDRLRTLAGELGALFPPLQAIGEGEIVTVHIAKLGQHEGQGVAYLGDGRKLVVSDGAPYLGATLDVQVDRIHRGVGGRELLFAHALGQS